VIGWNSYGESPYEFQPITAHFLFPYHYPITISVSTSKATHSHSNSMRIPIPMHTCRSNTYIDTQAISSHFNTHRRSEGDALGAHAPPAQRKFFWAKFTGENWKWTPTLTVYPHTEQESIFEEIAEICTVELW